LVEILTDSFLDTIKVVPLLFIIFFLVDFFMRRINEDNKFIGKLSKYDHFGGGLLGIIPQCGIPVAFANLYSSGHITLGMLIAIFISSSDEALLIIAAHPEKFLFILLIIVFKILIAIGSGFLVNLLIKEKRNRIKACGVDCSCPKCKKYKNIWVSNLVYTGKITLFLIITVFIINYGLDKLGQDNFNFILGKNNFLQPIFASLIGMIPSCVSSIVLAEAYIKGVIGFGTLIAGLCANTGYGILICLKELPLRKSIRIIFIIQFISIIIGEIVFFLWR
jgi:hypothetical protein